MGTAHFHFCLQPNPADRRAQPIFVRVINAIFLSAAQRLPMALLSREFPAWGTAYHYFPK
jgi:transposase